MSSTPKKPITCYYWAYGNRCKFTAEECKYTHNHTDTVAHPPKPLSRSTTNQKQIQEDLISLSSKRDDTVDDEKESLMPDDQPSSKLVSPSPESTEMFVAKELRAAISKDRDYGFIKNLLERESPSATKESLGLSTYGMAAMFDAVDRGRADLLRLMIEHGSDPNMRHNRSGVPVLALAIFQNNASAAVSATILLELGADPFVIPRDLWDNQANLDGHLIAQEETSKIQWCDNRHRNLLAKCFNLTIKHALLEAAKKERETMDGPKADSLVHVEYSNHLLIGQEYALRRVNEYLECHLLCGRKEPLVLAFVGPPGHGRTELARRIGNIKRLQIKPHAVADGEDVEGTPNCLSTGPGEVNVFCIDDSDKADSRHLFSALETMDKGKKGPVDSSSNVVVIDITEKEYNYVVYHNLKWEMSESGHAKSWDMYGSVMRRDLAKVFGPSTAGRIDCIVPFVPFTETEKTLLTHKFILDAVEGLTKSCLLIPGPNFGKHLSFTVDADTAVCEHIGETSYDVSLGARSIAQAVFSKVELRMVEEYKKAYPPTMNTTDRHRVTVHRPLNFVIRLKPNKSISVVLE